MNDFYIFLGLIVMALIGTVIWRVVSGSAQVPDQREIFVKERAANNDRRPVEFNEDPMVQAQALLKNRIEEYDGSFTLKPFGHELLNAYRRTVPEAYHGRWIQTSLIGKEKPWNDDSYAILEISSDMLRFNPGQTNASTLLVAIVENRGDNFLGESEVPEAAVICEAKNQYGWNFWMMMFSLQEGGTKLVNIESMDSSWTRIE